MEHLCPICAIDASSHSFELLSRDNGINVFYTCPAKATKYNDRDGILAHFKNVLDHYKDNYWKLIFDFQGVEFKHMMEINIAIGISKLINDYSTYLTEIQIINTNSYTYTMLRIVTPFLNSDVKNKINIKN
jgi:hypothetical protein